MSPTAQQIVAMLDRKRQIEQGTYMQSRDARQQWTVDAVELLLQMALERENAK